MLIGWLDTEEVREQWADAEQLSDDELAQYLGAAYTQCVAYLPPLDLIIDDPLAVPYTWPLAQLMQARALYRSFKAGSGDQLDEYGQTVTVFPMDWTVKNLLRPKKLGRIL